MAPSSSESGCSPSSASSSAHPLQERAKVLSCVRFLDVVNFSSLASPLPRSQDMPKEYFGAPSSSADQVISVSHAWRNQAHPDPTCNKATLLNQLLSKISSSGGNSPSSKHASIFLFFDFISIPQRPFLRGQEDRTVEEMAIFKRALECMHEVYFYSDRVIHLPWEDADLPEEGVEEMVPAEALRGATFVKIGDCIQVAMQASKSERSWRSIRSFTSRRRANLFDRVVSVDGQVITSIAQLESILAKSARTAKLRHYPFGNYSKIPADARGWVFLERFITMVKCAMMDEETAKHVVVTPSETIFQQIMRGARLLREASVQDAKEHRHGELKQVLESFTEELRSKQFSPASTDKRELAHASSMTDDQSTVTKIMHLFVEHLAEHWEAEAAGQQSLGKRLAGLVAVAETYLVEWEYFSKGYAAKLAAASTANPWPVAVVVFVPLAVTVVPLLLPYSAPSDGWASQPAFWCLGAPAACLSTFVAFPTFLAKATQMPYTWRVLLLFVGWAAVSTVVSVGLALGAAAAWDIFPTPMTHLLAAAVCAAFLPFLWWCIPKELRKSGPFRRRLCFSMVALAAVIGLFGMLVPLLNAAIPWVSGGWQSLLVSCYLLLKLGFELLGLKLSRVLGADVMPCFAFVATFAYQLNLCVAFSKVSSWLLVVEQICFDVLENCYHLYSLFRQQPSAEGGSGRREQYIVASLALREFLEIVVPASFLLLFVLLRAYHPDNEVFFCGRPEGDVRQTVKFLLVDIAVEFGCSCATYAILAYRGYTPFLLLRGLMATMCLCFTLMGGGLLSFYCTMQHSHWGLDLSFKFQWVARQDAIWKCGLVWS